MGLDSECDLLIDSAEAGNEGAAAEIHALLADLLSEHLGASVDTVEARLAAKGSLIATIDSFAGSQGRGLVLFRPEEPGPAERAFAESQIVDPESAGEAFEPIARPGLLARLRA